MNAVKKCAGLFIKITQRHAGVYFFHDVIHQANQIFHVIFMNGFHGGVHIA